MLKYYSLMYPCLGLVFLYGIIVGQRYVTLLHLIPTTNDKKYDLVHSGIALIVFGMGGIFSGYVGGKLCDIFPLKKVAYSAVLMYMLNCVLMLVASIL